MERQKDKETKRQKYKKTNRQKTELQKDRKTNRIMFHRICRMEII